MSTYKYNRYKILISPDSKKTQGLQPGDVVRRQYFDYPNMIYSLMVVLDTGIDVIGGKDSHYFIGALLEGDEPKTGELLDFVRITSLTNTQRTGALYLTASDSESPFMDVIDGMGMDSSLCFPQMQGGNSEIADKRKYACFGEKYLNADYYPSENDIQRIYSLARNGTKDGTVSFGLKQSIGLPLKNPMRVIVSFRVKASSNLSNVRVQLGYTDGKEIDGFDVINIGTAWEYKLFVVTIDYPSQYQRSFSIDLTNHLIEVKASCRIADLNIILQSDISTFANATKARVGKLKGVVDPVFGVLEGYGAYFQNMYATRNVNIAGTLTAGDENGFSSTFYVGKIHKNVILNSIACQFEGNNVSITDEATPVRIGKACQLGKDSVLKAQTAEWRKSHLDQTYCFSIWAKASEESTIYIYQDWYLIAGFKIEANREWKRYHAPFQIQDAEGNPFLYMRIGSSTTQVQVCAPQLEAGKLPSQNQPTDGTLSVVEDYGAWFSRGGIGGTIQNPLLKLNENGSISSRDNSFVINPDGTGHFASGRFKWTKDTIILQDVTIRWEDLDEQARENLQPKSVSLSGTNVFHYRDELDVGAFEPVQITIYASEHNFISTSRKWQYQATDNSWQDIAGNQKDFIRISPLYHYWENRNVLSIKYIAACDEKEYADIFTINKQFDGSSAYSVYISSSKGYIFRNGIVSTVLQAFVFKAGEDITALVPENNFTWLRISENKDADTLWNSVGHTGKSLEITGQDIVYKAVFDCQVIISTT